MGLAGRKQKQRIPADPRNLSWADDASRFGLSYLSKFGWDASQGLGSSGDGIKTHLKVQQKLDMMGIGAQHQRDPNGIAWKQNKEFEALLKRLNESVKGVDGEGVKEVSGSEQEMVMRHKIEEEKSRDDSTVKRKNRDDSYASDSNARKKRKKEKKKDQESSPSVSAIGSNSHPQSGPPESISKPRPMAHRARIRAAKRIAGKSASAISEILGIVPPTSSNFTPTPTSSSTPVPQPNLLSLDNLTTSTRSVADYFKEKLFARSTTSVASPSLASSGSAAGLGIALSKISPPDDENENEPPRRGIGSQVYPRASMSGDGGGTADDNRDTLMEKVRRKAERKAEKRKRREAEANRPENVPAIVKERVEEVDGESIQRTSKKLKKMKRRQEQERLEPVIDQSNPNHNGTTKISHEHDTKSRKEHERKHP